jgi:hypothetical protein
VRRLLLTLPLCLVVAPDPRTAVPPVRFVTPEAEPTIAEAPPPKDLGELARRDPVAALEASLRRYAAEVHGYRAVMQKQELLGGHVGPVEVIDVWFREKPFSVLMRWRTDSAGKADRALFVAGENRDQMLAHPKRALARALVGPVVERDPDGPEAQQSGRYSLREFGIRKGTERTLVAWRHARQHGHLRTEYLGLKPVADLGGRPCHILRRTCDPPAEDDIVTVEVQLDAETWLQTGTVLTAAGGKLVGSYFFRDVVPNPSFPPDLFTRDAVVRDAFDR